MGPRVTPNSGTPHGGTARRPPAAGRRLGYRTCDKYTIYKPLFNYLITLRSVAAGFPLSTVHVKAFDPGLNFAM